MNNRPKLRTSILLTALAACAATAWATNTTLSNSSYVPAVAAHEEPVVTTVETTAIEATPTVTEVGPTIAITEEPAPAIVPVTQARVAPSITVEEQRLTQDQRIQADVMDLLARNPRLSGRIGVETADSVVTLSGWVATSGQAWRAGRDVRGVQGVRHVVNEIRPRVGGSV
jgi:hypothetical protein